MGLFSEKIQRVISNFSFVSGVKKRIKAQKKRSGIKSKFQPRPPEDPEVIKARWEKKKDRIHQLAHNISRLRLNVTKSLKSEDEKEALTALVLAIMMATGERIGNEDSADNGHFGVSVFKKSHIHIKGDEITLTYKGKSGVDHEKTFRSEKIAKALKKAIRNSPSKYVFETSEGQRIRPERINLYLKDFSINSKDIRGHYVNRGIVEKLSALEIPENENDRKRLFNQVCKKAANNVGHGAPTCKKHYIVPELSEEYINHGKIIDLKSQNYYKDGGKIEKSTRQVESEAPTKKSEQLLAPNGKPSNLTPIQYRLVRTPEFKKWFGDWENDRQNSSKVVDENGEPLVVWHGTKKHFTIFTRGDFYYHFGTKEAALERGSKINTFFLNIKRPLTTEDFGWWIDSSKWEMILGVESDRVDEKEKIKYEIKKKGYDGIEYENIQEDKGSTSYIVFESNQIKLADGTNTTFNPNNPDIRYEGGGKLKPEKPESKSRIQLSKHGRSSNSDYLSHKYRTNYLVGGKIWYKETIDDSDYRFIKEISDIELEKPYFLEEIIKHDKLFEKYPHIRKIIVIFEEIESDDDDADSYTNISQDGNHSIIIRLHFSYYKKHNHEKFKLGTTKYPEFSKEATLLHELQHVLQFGARGYSLFDGRSRDQEIASACDEYSCKSLEDAHSKGLRLKVELSAHFAYITQRAEQEARWSVDMWLKKIGLEYGDKRFLIYDDESKFKQLFEWFANLKDKHESGGLINSVNNKKEQTFQQAYKKQIDDYRKEGIFIKPTDNPIVGSLPISRFNGVNADILPSQNYVYRMGVGKWKIKIREGERPHVLINIDNHGTPRVEDGHHRLKAYEELGFIEIPVIDVNGKILIGSRIKERERIAKLRLQA